MQLTYLLIIGKSEKLWKIFNKPDHLEQAFIHSYPSKGTDIFLADKDQYFTQISRVSKKLLRFKFRVFAAKKDSLNYQVNFLSFHRAPLPLTKE